MGRLNIKHPKTGLYRCWSTIIDDWVSEWLSEEDYKQWLIDEAINKIKTDLEEHGIEESKFYTYDELQYHKLVAQHCITCSHDDCNNCICYYNFEYYKQGVLSGEIENILKMEFTK